jgi:hypothetical protein
MLRTSMHVGSPMGRMRLGAIRSLRVACTSFCVIACLFFSGFSGAAAEQAEKSDPAEVSEEKSFAATPSPVEDNPHVPRQFTGRYLQLSLQQAGDTSNGLLQVFKMNLRKLLPKSQRNWGSFFRPFLLAGKADLQQRDGRTYGLQIPGAKRITALHIGAGADVSLGDHWRMTAHVGELMHSGGSRLPNDSRYRVSFGYDF